MKNKTNLTSFAEENLIGTSSYTFSDNSEELNKKIADLCVFFETNGISYSSFLQKQAYPNFEHFMHVPGQHNTDKWLETVRDIYFKEKQGESRSNIIREVTSGWKPTETYDFLNWLKFYEEGSHLKYKVASWYENGQPGYFLHIDSKPEEKTNQVTSDINSAKDSHVTELSDSHKKQIINKQKNKIIGRLDSAEKLLRSDEGQLFAGKELESLIESIYNLKKKVQLVNKISTSVKLYEDMIVREANVLVKKGFSDAAELLYTLADDKAAAAPAAAPEPPKSEPPKTEDPKPEASKPEVSKQDTSSKSEAPSTTSTSTAPSSSGPETSLTPAPPPPPTQGSGSAGGIPAPIPGEPLSDKPGNAAPGKPQSPGISAFLQGTQTSNLTDTNSIEDDLEVIDEEGFWSQAQVAETAPPAAPVVPKTPSENKQSEELEVFDDQPLNKNKEIKQPVSKFDNKINDAFATITIQDIVSKLEDLSKIFKTREVPRQLAIADMMLDSLGLAPYFPALSEATNKALESNNYISTRVDDVLSKLRGSLKTKDIDLRGEEISVTNPEVEAVKRSLETTDMKEQAKKEVKKQQEEDQLGLNEKVVPEIEIEETAPSLPAPSPTPTPAAPPVPSPAPKAPAV